MGERDASNLNVAYDSVSVEDLQGNAMALDDPDEGAELVAVQFWNPGCANPTCWTGKNFKKCVGHERRGGSRVRDEAREILAVRYR